MIPLPILHPLNKKIWIASWIYILFSLTLGFNVHASDIFYEISTCECIGSPTPVTATPIGTTGEVKFTINCLPQGTVPSCPNADYRLFWDFGDGQYAFGQDNPTHTYLQDGNYQPKLIITKRYSDDDPEVALQEVISLNTSPTTITVEGPGGFLPHPNQDSCIRIKPVQDAYAGEDIWVIVSFMNYPNNQSPVDIEFTYDSGKFSYDIFRFYGSGLSLVNESPGALQWQFDPGQLSNNVHHIFVKLTTSYTAEGSYEFYSTISERDSICTQMDHLFSSDKNIGPKDPNTKLVNISYTNQVGPEELTYSIEFYNIGTGEAKKITILDTLSSQLDLCHLQMSHVVINNISIPISPFNDRNLLPVGDLRIPFLPKINYEDRTLEWVWDFNGSAPPETNTSSYGSGIKGLWQAGHGYKNSSIAVAPGMRPETVAQLDPSTMASIVFKIKTNCDFDFGDTIRNRASIQFEDLEWFTTDSTNTIKVCCDSLLPTTIQAGDSFSIQSLYTGSLVPNSISANFESGLPIGLATPGYYEYLPGTDSLDRVVISICDSLGKCETQTWILCIYSGTPPPCDNSSCQEIPVTGCTPAPCSGICCRVIAWPLPIKIGIVLALILGLILIFRFFIKRRRNG